MDASGKLSLTVVTPERALIENAPCDEVTLPGSMGELGILPEHTPLITLLGPGLVTYRDSGTKAALAVRGGVAEVTGHKVRVLVEDATTVERVDRTLTEKQRAEATDRLLRVVGDVELETANADIAFAEAKLKLAALGSATPTH